MKYRPDIDGMRCIAVVAVLLFHVDLPFVPGGFVGVDMFFVLSGYLITANVNNLIMQHSFSLKTFYLRRFWRLFPALIVTIALTFFAAIFCLTDGDLKRLALSAFTSIASISNFQFWKESGYFDTDATLKPLLHTWSLATEEQFYVFWPVTLLAIHSCLPNRTNHQLAVVFAILLTSLAACEAILRSHHSSSTAFYLFPFRTYEFMVGSILHWLPKPHSRKLNSVLSSLALIFLIAVFFSYDGTRLFPGLTALYPCLATSVLLHCASKTPIAHFLSKSPVVYIGRISYSLYLTHWPLITLYRYVTGHQVLSALDSFLLTLISVLFATILHHNVESRFYSRPHNTPPNITPKRKRTQSASPLTPFSAILLSSLLSAIFLQCHKSNGWPWRSALLNPPSACNATAPTGLPLTLEQFDDLLDIYHKSKRHRTYDKHGPVAGSLSPSATHMLILGDSLAHQFLPLAHYYGTKYNILFHVWWYGACPGLQSVYAVYNALDFGSDTLSHEHECRQRQVDWFDDLPRFNFSAVFLASRWHKFVEPAEYLSTAPIPQMYFLPLSSVNSSRNPSLARSRAMFPVALSRTVSFLNNAKVKVILISQAPHPGLNPAHCLTRPVLFRRDSKTQPPWCVRATRQQALERVRFTGEALREVGLALNGEVLLLEHILCGDMDKDEGFCRVVWCDKVLYRNADHLSDFGALYTALRWEMSFRKLLGMLPSHKTTFVNPEHQGT